MVQKMVKKHGITAVLGFYVSILLTVLSLLLGYMAAEIRLNSRRNFDQAVNQKELFMENKKHCEEIRDNRKDINKNTDEIRKIKPYVYNNHEILQGYGVKKEGDEI